MEAFLLFLASKLTVAKAIGLVGARLMLFATLAAVLVPLERLIPFHAGQRLFRKHFALDLLHFFVTGMIIIAFVTLTYHFMPMISNIQPATVRGWPEWAKLLAFEAGWTFLGYWLHRLEHVWGPLWRLHSIHECTEEIDWLAAFRIHPLEPMLFQVFTIIPLWFLGISLPVVIGYSLYSYVLTHVQHSNVVFPIGPLKYLLPTPEFHRWHHARIYDAGGGPTRPLCNFGAYPVWDILFGTFYLPQEKPSVYGNALDVPPDYLAQLAYPFGAHERVLAWERALCERLGLSERMRAVGAALEPAHEALEGRLAGLALIGSRQPAGKGEELE